jgi:prolyl-tRNA editing enzyme YbaK/EbsC (Cys-tRNA(Pro) deacylase)
MSDPSTRLHPPRAVLESLERLGVAFELVPCDPALSDTAAFSVAYGYPLDRIANAIVVRSRSDPGIHAVSVVLASTRLDVNGAARRRLGVRKASFASAQESTALTRMPPGGVGPFGLPDELVKWVDDRAIRVEQLIVGSGERASKLLLPGSALTRIPGIEVVAGLGIDRPASADALE